VGGGIPVIRSLRSSLRNAPVKRIAGILNGTSNYVLTRIEEGDSFEEAIKQAQRNGFAEADSTRDLNGTDSADKLRILAWIAFGVRPADLDVAVTGILPDPERLVSEAKHAGCRVRLIAQCEQTANGVHASVSPVAVPLDSAFARTTDEQNLISIDLGWRQPIILTGPGAGGLPTATALLGDLVCS
jgi:homoserine dehydrogenase